MKWLHIMVPPSPLSLSLCLANVLPVSLQEPAILDEVVSLTHHLRHIEYVMEVHTGGF